MVLDVAAEREPHREPSQTLLSFIELKKAKGFISAASYPTLYYLLQREIGADDAKEFLRVLTELLSVVSVDKTLLVHALKIGVEDYEDAIQIACAEVCRADFIVTRDVRGYKKSAIKALTPSEYLATH